MGFWAIETIETLVYFLHFNLNIVVHVRLLRSPFHLPLNNSLTQLWGLKHKILQDKDCKCQAIPAAS